jgi:hypothetical protein
MKFFYWVPFLFFINNLIVGCSMPNDIVSNMDEAYLSAINMKGDTQQTREAAVTQAVYKYLYPGMQKEAAFLFLMELKKNGFEIGEYRHEGARDWPDGILKPYLENDMKRHFESLYPKGVSTFYATIKYETSYLIFNKTASISFKIIEASSVIQDVTGSISVNGL